MGSDVTMLMMSLHCHPQIATLMDNSTS